MRVILDGLDELEDRSRLLLLFCVFYPSFCVSIHLSFCFSPLNAFPPNFPCRFSARTLLHFIGDERFKSNNPGLSSNSPWSRFIVSCSSDQTLADVRSRGASSRLENIGAHVVKMPELTFDTQSLSGGAPRPKASCFIEHVLKHQRRQLQPFQLEYICQQLSAITLSSLSGHPLHDLPPSSPAYVNVLARQARRINNLDMRPFPDMNRCALRVLCFNNAVLTSSAVGAAALVPSSAIACLTPLKRISGPNLLKERFFASHPAGLAFQIQN